MKLLLLTLLALPLLAATGKVIALPSSYTADGANTSGNTPSNMFDGNLATYWETNNQFGGWAGAQLGASATIVGYRITPRASNSSGMFEYRIGGSQLQSAASCTSSTFGTATTADTIPTQNGLTYPFMPRNQFSERDAAAWTGTTGVSAPCWRLLTASPGEYGNVAEVELIATAGTGFNAKPMYAQIAPWGGHYPNQAFVTVTLSSQTTSAALYYTLDGTTPSNTNGTLYSAPFHVTPGTPLTFKAVAYASDLSTTLGDVSTAYFDSRGWVPQSVTYDVTTGNQIYAGTPTILYQSGTYYLFSYNNNFANNPGLYSGQNTWLEWGVWLSTSTDLENWTQVGEILDNGESYKTMIFVERPTILYNASTSKWVMWTHAFGSTSGGACNTSNPYNQQGYNIATSSFLDHGWTYSTLCYGPPGSVYSGVVGPGDLLLFQDLAGTGYVIFSQDDTNSSKIQPLASDYLSSISSGASTLNGVSGHEGYGSFIRNGKIWMITGPYNPYNSVANATNLQAQYATTATGTWSSAVNLWASEPVANTPYNTQGSAGVIQIPGKSDCWLLATDWWSPTSLWAGSSQTWVQLQFSTDTSVNAQQNSGWDWRTSCAPSYQERTTTQAVVCSRCTIQ